ncbi:MAG TPA: hypothetical protein VFT36_07295 [Methylomirabilota bacterium]|nr:hypothetical protein [Methylomirabilota bacterium]
MPRRLLLALIGLALAACSEDQSGTSPAERAKQGKGMSDEIWKIYSGTESGVADEAKEPKKDEAKSAPDPAPAKEAPPAPPKEKR